MALAYSPVLVDEESLQSLKELTRDVTLKDSQKLAYTGTGSSNSPFRTRGLDFQEIRAYQPGDDIRQIDWKTTAKHGKPFTKLFTDEKERPVYFICDLRGCMRFATQGEFKSVIAARMTMFLAWLVERKKDRIGALVLLPKEIKVVDLHNNGSIEGLIASLVEGGTPTVEEEDEITLEEALKTLAEDVKSGAMIFICSDLHDLTDEGLEILKRLTAKRTISLIQIYDELEQQLPYGLLTMTNGAQVAAVDMTNKNNRNAFEEIFKKQTEKIETTVKRQGWGYLLIKTTDDYLKMLMSFAKGVV